ncbi:MAG: hypothetical protein KAI83_02010 [Thiomargarita sp.]|nr:hypothetical protein [Thiomargarita sp.]
MNSKMLPKDKALNSKMIIAELDQIISQPTKCQLQYPLRKNLTGFKNLSGLCPVSETSKRS